MSVPYLDRGETIILTTHRVSVGNTEYDALLTTKRLILMDRRYTRFEPRMILFPAIVSVKAGRIPAGEPAIVLTLEQPSDISGSERANIIFLQEPGEDRTPEREQWVKELIALVIASREQGIRNQISTSSKKSGVQPSVRRWVAPDTPTPHTTHESPTLSHPEPEVIAEGPDPMEFFLETKNPEWDTLSKSEEQGTLESSPVIPSQEKPILPQEPPKWPKIRPSVGSVFLPDEPVHEDFRGVEKQPPFPPAKKIPDPVTAESFARIITTAAEPFHVKKDDPPEHSPIEPEQVDEVAVPVVDEPDVLPLSGNGDSLKKTPLEPDVRESAWPSIQSSGGKSVAVPDAPAPGTLRELPGTYTPDIPVLINRNADEIPPAESKSPTQNYRAIAGILFILALLVIFGSVAVIFHLLPVQENTLPLATITPAIPSGSIGAADSSVSSQEGIEVRVEYPGSFFGTVGNPGYLQPVSGTGNRTIPILPLTSIVQVTIQKQDNTGNVLTVEICNNQTSLIKKSVSAPKGSINLLIDVDTGLPPGLNKTDDGSATLLGNGSLIYY